MRSPYRTADGAVVPNAFCPLCGGRLEQAVCTRCRVPDVVCEPVATTLACPRCELALHGEQLDTVPVTGCATCRGVFLSRPAWDDLLGAVNANERVDTKHLVPPPPSVSPSTEALFAPSRCPSCRTKMDRVTFAAASRTVIDVCAKHGIWFDAVELVAVLGVLSQRLDGIEPKAATLSEAERDVIVARMHTFSEHAVKRLESIPIPRLRR